MVRTHVAEGDGRPLSGYGQMLEARCRVNAVRLGKDAVSLAGGTGFSYALKGRSGALGYFTVGRITPMALSAESRTESATQPHPHHSHVGARPARDSRAGPAPTGSREARYFSVADLVRDGRTYRRGSRMRSPTLPHPRHSHVGARPARDSRAGPAYGSRKHGRRSNCLAGCTEMRLNGWVEPWRNPCGRGDGYRFAQHHPTKSHARSCGADLVRDWIHRPRRQPRWHGQLSEIPRGAPKSYRFRERCYI